MQLKMKSIGVSLSAFSFSATVTPEDDERIFITLANNKECNQLVVVQGQALICNVATKVTETPYPVVIADTMTPNDVLALIFGKLDKPVSYRERMISMAVYQSCQHLNHELKLICERIDSESMDSMPSPSGSLH